MKNIILLITLSCSAFMNGQTTITGTISAGGMPLSQANVVVHTLKKATTADSEGNYSIANVSLESYEMTVS